MVALYFLGWLIVVFAQDNTVELPTNSTLGTNVTTYNPLKRLIFLTNWGFLIWTGYLLVAAMACTVKMVFWVWSTAHGKREPEVDPADHLQSVVVKWSEDRVGWYQKVQWVLYSLAVPLQFAVVILYWGIILPYSSNIYTAINFHVHLVGGVFAAIDLLTSGVLVSVYHMYCIIFLGILYIVFSSVYDVYGGTSIWEDPFIYAILDYTGNPGLAVGVAIGTVFAFTPVVYLATYALAGVRRWLVHKCRARCCCDCSNTSKAGEESIVPLKEPPSGNV